MKRRKFLLGGGIIMLGNLCGRLARLTPAGDSRAPEPTLTSIQLSTPQAIVGAERAAQPNPPVLTDAPTAAAPEDSPTPTTPAAQPFVDDFTGLTALPDRITTADSMGQVSLSEGSLRINGTAPGRSDPCVYDRQVVSPGDNLVAGVRFKTGWMQETGWMGLASAGGQAPAGLRRTVSEGEGGTLACGGKTFPVLNLYSECWYDFITFLTARETAFAVNDGAGLELVLVAESVTSAREGEESPAHLGYWAAGGEEQGASIAAWYAIPAAAGLPELVSQAEAAPGFEADLGTNAAWLETRIEQSEGCAGLRFRSIDPRNEYRVYLDGADLKVDQVVEGNVTPLEKRPLAYRTGAKLAIRYNELTLTVYYDGALTGITNRKIGAPGLLEGTIIGVYATGPGSSFRQLAARPVRCEVPEELSSRLLRSRQVLCLGDSLTSADKAYGYQNRLRKQLGDGWATVDCGVPNQTSYQIAARLPGHMRRYHSEVLIVLGGTNDISRNYPVGMIQPHLKTIYASAKQAGMRVVAITIPPQGSSKDWTAEKQASLEAVNAWILGAANVDYRVDAYALLKDPGGDSLQGRYDGGDHVHLGPDGCNALANAIFRTVAW